jgi:hypothetical protein
MTTAMITPRKPGRLTCVGAQVVLALVAVCSWAVLAMAATVTPSDRVTTYLVVRNRPSRDAGMVGKLGPSEKAETIESVPRWLKVRLSDGTVGYVSKAWVEEVEAAPSPAAPAATPAPATVTAPPNTPAPLLEAGHPVDWWFVFKMNGSVFPECGNGDTRQCPFGGDPPPDYRTAFGQQFVYACSEAPALQKGTGCVGETTTDPVGATFDEIYRGAFHYVLWNDQFYNDPPIHGCSTFCGAPWAHSKGLVAWDDAGDGLIMQVSTPSWPAAGSSQTPRHTDGNTLGCVHVNDVMYSQHFFALRLTKADLITVLNALRNASVVTDVSNRQIVSNGGPPDVQNLVNSLGTQVHSKVPTHDVLSTKVILVSKPSDLAVPPWQMVSAVMGGVPLRVATWWSQSKIYSTTDETDVTCWDPVLGPPAPVEIALSGHWESKTFNLTGGGGTDANHNHAKIGVSTGSGTPYAFFGDMNQEGTLTGEGDGCKVKQNPRGGLFFAVNIKELHDSVAELIKGGTAGTAGP